MVMSKKHKKKDEKSKISSNAVAEKSAAKPTITNHDGWKEHVFPDGTIQIEAYHYSLCAVIEDFLGGVDVASIQKKNLYHRQTRKGLTGPIDLQDLLHAQTHIMLARIVDTSIALVHYLQAKWDAKFPGQKQEILRAGDVKFESLPVLFPVGSQIAIRDKEDPQRDLGAEVVKITFDNWRFAYNFEVRYLEALGGAAVYAQKSVMVRYFAGSKSFADLTTYPIDADTLSRFTERGEKFRKIAQNEGPMYMQYGGNMILDYGYGETPVRSDGRIMIDSAGFSRFDERQFQVDQRKSTNRWWEENNSDDDEASTTRCALTDNVLWMTAPMVPGYSLTAKRWGKFMVGLVSNIEFRDKAIDQLVLDEKKKKLIIALVRHNGDKVGFKDIIAGKGGGTIFLLHGPPGTGKTLTAEAVAETLHQPLYSVSIGELGTDPQSLEEKLSEILELASMWKAVLLLDEADIFLEKRGSDITRNAMTGVFLRLLEYYPGVMMLTTNRISDFDPAFHSRIALAINYPKMDESMRTSVWRNLLDAAGYGYLDARRLSKLGELNGREIKNLICVASTAAKEDKQELDYEHLEGCYAMQQEFNPTTINPS